MTNSKKIEYFHTRFFYYNIPSQSDICYKQEVIFKLVLLKIYFNK
jgi:hypothetical protein